MDTDMQPPSLFQPGSAPGRVRMNLAVPVAHFIQGAADNDDLAPMYAPQAPSSDTGDLFDHLEMEMAADAVSESVTARAGHVREIVEQMVDEAYGKAASGRGQEWADIPEKRAQALLEYLNRAYVRLRRSDLTSAGQDTTAGLRQPAADVLGLGDDADVEFGGHSAVLGWLVQTLVDALDASEQHNQREATR